MSVSKMIFVLNKKDFLNVAGFIPNFETELIDNGVILSGDGDVFKFETDKVGDFPVIEKTGMQQCGVIGANDQKRLQTAGRFAGKDELREAMMHVAFKDAHIMATDGHTLFFEKSELVTDKSILISKQVIALFDLFKELFTVSQSDNYLQFENDQVIISQRICDSSYPDCLAVIPDKTPIQVSVDKKLFSETVKKALTMANMTTNVITMNTNENLLIESKDIDLGKEYSKSIAATITGGEIFIGFNGKMLLNILSEIETKGLNFAMSEPNRPVIINGNILQMPIMTKHYS